MKFASAVAFKPRLAQSSVTFNPAHLLRAVIQVYDDAGNVIEPHESLRGNNGTHYQ
jgi:hypothetical protein